MAEKKRKLFEDFPAVPAEQWEEKIRQDLKGADYEKKLVWKTGEGFQVKPYYRAEDLQDKKYLEVVPGAFPFVRGNHPNNNWYVRQDIRVDDIGEANKKALDILMKGIDSLGFTLNGRKEYAKQDIDRLLKNIFAEIVELNFDCLPGLAKNITQIFYDLVVQYNRDFQKIHGSVNYEPLGYLVLRGEFFRSMKESFDLAGELIDIVHHFPGFTVVSVNGYHYHNSGASIVEELAFSLAEGTEYLTQLTERNFSIDRVAPNLKFNFGTGSNYFMEIAKFRAARMLWANIVKAYGPSKEEHTRMNIHAVTSDWNKTLYDPYVNMLRTTTEAMSAVIAGIDSLTVKPFNAVFEKPSEFSERIARNQQLLLKEESYLDKVTDPAGGSYYIESLTDSIASEAWKLFLETESEGGFIEAFKQGFIQEKIKQTAARRDEAIARRRESILGTNQYPDCDDRIERMVDAGVFQPMDLSTDNPLAETLKPYRGSQAFERLRYQTDQYALEQKRPRAFMLTHGNLAMRLARARFSGNFFACAGYDIIDNLGFDTPAHGVQAAFEQEADIIVICSSDEEYPEIVPEIVKAIGNKAIPVVAGYPEKQIGDLEKAGVKHFIHLRSNVLESLQGFQKELGVANH